MRSERTFTARSSFFITRSSTTEIYTLSLHDALPISSCSSAGCALTRVCTTPSRPRTPSAAGWSSSRRDRKSTRLNSSHSQRSYAVFCLKKKIGEDVHRAVGVGQRALLAHDEGRVRLE